MKALYDSGELNSANTNAVKEPSKRLIIGENVVRKRVEHLEYLKLKKNKRAEAKRSSREGEDRKTYKDYDWINLYRTNESRKVTGKVVEKYLCHFKLPKVRLVLEKCKIVQHHIERSLFASNSEELSNKGSIAEESINSENSSLSVSDELSSGDDEVVGAYDGFESTDSFDSTSEKATQLLEYY